MKRGKPCYTGIKHIANNVLKNEANGRDANVENKLRDGSTTKKEHITKSHSLYSSPLVFEHIQLDV